MSASSVRPSSLRSSPSTSALAASDGELDRSDVGDQLVDLLGGERSAALGAPGRHRRAGPAVDEDLAQLFDGEAEQHRVEGRGPPGDGGDELTLGVGERVRRCLSADALGAVAAGAVVAALLRGREQPGASVDEGLVEVLDGSGLPAGLVEPVEREAHRGDRDEDQAAGQRPVEAGAFELLVVVVGLAVRRQLDLRADLGPALAEVDEDVAHHADAGDDGDDDADCLHRGGGHHGAQEKRVIG